MPNTIIPSPYINTEKLDKSDPWELPLKWTTGHPKSGKVKTGNDALKNELHFLILPTL